METRAHYVAVGAFVLAMIALGFVAVLWIARSSLTTEYARFDIYFKGPVTGLRNGAAVEYNGVPVGKVIEIKIVPFEKKLIDEEDTGDTTPADDAAPANMIRVTAEIDANVEIKQDVRASVEANILSGVAYILIVKGTQEARLLLPQAGQRYAAIRSHRSRSITASAPQLIKKASDTLDHVNDMLDEKNRRAVSEIIENVRVLSAGLSDTNKDIAELSVNANAAVLTLSNLLTNVDRSYAGPDGLGSRLTTAIADYDRVAKDLQLALQDVRPGVRSFSQHTLSDVGALVGEARQLISGLSRLTAEIERDPSRVLFGDRREGYRPR